MRDLVEMLDQEIARLRDRLPKLEAARDALAALDDGPASPTAPKPGRPRPIAPESQAEARAPLVADEPGDAENRAPCKAQPVAEAPKPPRRSASPTSRPGWTATRGPGSCTAPGGGHAGPTTTHACAAPGCAWSISRCEAHTDQRLRGAMGGHMRAHRHGTPPAAPESPAMPSEPPTPTRDTRRGMIARLASGRSRQNACGVCGEKGHGARRCPKRTGDEECDPGECECGNEKKPGAECCAECRALDGNGRRRRDDTEAA